MDEDELTVPEWIQLGFLVAMEAAEEVCDRLTSDETGDIDP